METKINVVLETFEETVFIDAFGTLKDEIEKR